MAVKTGNGTLTASTVATETLTGWAPYVAISISSSVAGVANVTVGNSSVTAPVVGADDTYVVTSGTTLVVRNPIGRAGLQTVDSTYTTLTNPTQGSTTVKLISAAALVYSVQLVNDPGGNVVVN
jgi:hypothetical protein